MSIENQAKEQGDNEQYSKNFARIPNMLFASFIHLTKEEKFLYCTLKSVYWDAKPRFVTLRQLSGMTGYSTGALSKMLPRLHDCGLIHAEIRREKKQSGKGGREAGQPKYQISILDIWELNRLYYSSTPDKRDLLDPSLKLVLLNTSDSKSVQQMNTSVHEMNTSNLNSVHEMNTPVHFVNTIDGISKHVEQVDRPSKESGKEDKDTSIERKDNSPSISPSSESSTDKEKPSIWTPEEETLLQWLDSAKIGRNKDTNVVKGQLKELVPVISSVEKLHKLIEFAKGRIRGDDPTVWLGNLVGNNLKAWLQHQEPEQDEEQVTPPAPSDQIGMSREECEDLIYNSILALYPSLVVGMDEYEGLYSIGIAKGENEWIDIANPTHWYHLPQEEIDLALAYSEQRLQTATA